MLDLPKTIMGCREVLDKGELSATELTNALFDRIEKNDGTIGAYLTLCRENAQERAKEIDTFLSTQRHDIVDTNEIKYSVLLGIPYACKDNLVTRGIRTTCASHILQDFVPPYDAVAVERMDSAGSILLGKTNLDEFAMGSDCTHSALGKTVHPFDPTRSPGGSSGGSAAAVASGEAIFALGSDTGGSARQPAAFCGLVSMKPTYGLIPRYGLVEFASSMDTICPMTHTVADNRLVLSALAGYDPRDMTSLALSPSYTRALADDPLVCDLKAKKIAIPIDWNTGVDAATANNTARVVQKLIEAGCIVEEVTLPKHALEVYVILTTAESSSNLARYDGIRYGTPGEGESYRVLGADARSRGFGSEVTRRILTGTYALSKAHGGAYFAKIKAVQAEIMAQMDEILTTYDAILTPTTGSVAFPLEANAVDRYDSDRFTVYANLTGLPAIQLPSGGDGKLPTGVSFLGRRYGEVDLYQLAAWLEETLAEENKMEVYHGRI